jgi:transposase InsO family protein
LNQELMRRLDEEYTKHPFFGSRKLTVRLRKAGFAVNRKRIQGLMRRMGLEAIYRKPRLSLPGRQHKWYPYFLKGITIDRPDQAWCADITYIRLAHGFVYLVAILDWHSRYVLATKKSIFTNIGRSPRRGRISERIFGSTTKSGRTKRSAIGRRTRFTSGARPCWRRPWKPWFNMDRAEIAVPGSNDEDVFPSICAKMAFGYGNG